MNAALPSGHSSQQGRYKIVDLLGQGRMGTVYRAFDNMLGRDVAIKTPLDALCTNKDLISRFCDEARIAAQIQHPGIPAIHDVGRLPDDRVYYVMKLISGSTFSHILSQRTDLREGLGATLSILHCVCQVMAYAHARQVVHLDLTPDNIMIGLFHEVQVIDWGLAIVDWNSNYGGQRELEHRTAAVYGPPGYMSPEQAVGAMLDCRSDVFVLGGVLCHILTGLPPYTGSNTDELLRKAIANDTDDAFDRLNTSGAHAGLIELAMRCLGSNPSDRPSTAEELTMLLEAIRVKCG